jgi:hypothetical protein
MNICSFLYNNITVFMKIREFMKNLLDLGQEHTPWLPFTHLLTHTHTHTHTRARPHTHTNTHTHTLTHSRSQHDDEVNLFIIYVHSWCSDWSGKVVLHCEGDWLCAEVTVIRQNFKNESWNFYCAQVHHITQLEWRVTRCPLLYVCLNWNSLVVNRWSIACTGTVK